MTDNKDKKEDNNSVTRHPSADKFEVNKLIEKVRAHEYIRNSEKDTFECAIVEYNDKVIIQWATLLLEYGDRVQKKIEEAVAELLNKRFE